MRKIEVTVNEAMSQAIAEFIQTSERKARSPVTALENAVAQYVDAKRAIERLEAVMKTHKPAIEEALRASGGKAEIAGHKLSLVEFERESFSLSEAKEKLDLRMLRPFIKSTQVVQVRIGRTL
jgi:transposase